MHTASRLRRRGACGWLRTPTRRARPWRRHRYPGRLSRRAPAARERARRPAGQRVRRLSRPGRPMGDPATWPTRAGPGTGHRPPLRRAVPHGVGRLLCPFAACRGEVHGSRQAQRRRAGAGAVSRVRRFGDWIGVPGGAPHARGPARDSDRRRRGPRSALRAHAPWRRTATPMNARRRWRGHMELDGHDARRHGRRRGLRRQRASFAAYRRGRSQLAAVPSAVSTNLRTREEAVLGRSARNSM